MHTQAHIGSCQLNIWANSTASTAHRWWNIPTAGSYYLNFHGQSKEAEKNRHTNQIRWWYLSYIRNHSKYLMNNTRALPVECVAVAIVQMLIKNGFLSFRPYTTCMHRYKSLMFMAWNIFNLFVNLFVCDLSWNYMNWLDYHLRCCCWYWFIACEWTSCDFCVC